MASYFIYDSINQYRSDNTVSDGTFGSGFSASSTAGDAVTNFGRVSDQNIGTVISAVAANDAIAYTLGTAATANAIAVYFTGDDGVVANGDEMTVRAGNAVNALTSAGKSFASNNGGWSVSNVHDSGNYTDVGSFSIWCVEFNEALTNISEILIGRKLDFEVEPDVNIQSSINYENEVQRSLGGVEYAININEGQEVHTISFQNVSSTFKTNLITMQDALKGEAKKFVWYDGSSFHWVRLDKPMTFTEIADGRFSTQIVLRQQIQ